VLRVFMRNLKPGPLGQVRVNGLCPFFVLFVHFLWCQRKRTKRNAPVSFGPSDYFVLLKAAGILKTRGVYTPLRGAQTVGVCAYLKIL
jgi:hypothetical protein